MLQAVSRANQVNGIDLDALKTLVRDVLSDPAKAEVGFQVTSCWQGGTRSDARVASCTVGGRTVRRAFVIPSDEPYELLGENSAPNPQELLMAALNACVMVGYVAGAAMNGINLEKLEIETSGRLDLRGFLGLDDQVTPGYEGIHCRVIIKGDGTDAQFREIHETVARTSPNYFNFTQPVPIHSELVVEH